ncbi:IclR family transcriptional regulator [Natronosalvus rutilus]|uniref:IclR family transcriptional regulator n=1 Tax=Natronosalvus rutilus TaxID=2953753 RepID=A0A9E7N880_9EURY|nr:IclR family transcriptional regulator [Natronosalvus rutilus]UTF52666.1 IclR family transcriptional regulator [Natronosalvus rutilus]
MSEQSTPTEGGRRIQAVETTCELLDTLRERGSSGVSELARETGYSKATVHSHLATLLDNEFVVKRGNGYEISLKFVDFGEFAKNGVAIHEIAKQEVDKLAEQTGEVAQFMVEEHGRGVYLHKARGANAIRTASYTGERKDLHCTALGKAILTQLPRERVEEIIEEHGLPAHTENTVSTREELFDELETIRQENVAYDDEEVLSGLRCVAAPIVYKNGDIQGAISISGPTSRFKRDRFREELPEIVRSAANVIEVNSTQV